MDLLRRLPSDVLIEALSDWHWIPEVAGKSPLAATAFGDVFLEGDDGVWFLDTVEGKLTLEWESPASLQAQLNTAEGQDRYLMAGLARAAYEAGLAPGDREVFSFKVPPVLGGPLVPDNLEVGDLGVALSVAGQIHQQVKDLPPGSTITGVTIDGE